MRRLLAALAFTLAGAAHAQTGVTVGMQLEPPILDPTAGAAAAIDEVTYANVFEGLTRFAPDGSIVPGLARSWTISDDGLTYTFHLVEGATFHDGAPFDADAVVFSLDRARDPEGPNTQQALYAAIERVEALDPATVRVTLSRPVGMLLFNLAWGDAVIVHPDTAETNATEPVGTGPFRFASWARGDRIVLERNPDYWGEPAALERATFRFIADPNAAFAAVMTEDVDVFPGFPAPELLAQIEADPRFDVVLGSTEGQTILAMNHRREALADVRVRRAIAHAIDRQAIIDGAMFGFGVPIGTHFAPHHPAYLDLTAQSAHDPEQAKALLAEAGAEGLRLSLKLPPPAYARRGGEIVAAQLRAVGIETTIANLEWAQWLEEVFRGHDFDLTIIAHTEPMDIGIYARPDYYFGYRNPAFDAVIAALDAESDPDAQTRLLQEAQRILADDFVNAFLFQLPRTGVANARLSGLWENAPHPANDLTGVSWR
ncbi:MAG: ABC transporter substrate-binding protein [Rhodobacteraceae bacterium]|nr:MAG: ABC transporter substrate-binding protein [Paracoccaceae bacterium]